MVRYRQLFAIVALLLLAAPATALAKLVPTPGGGSLEALNEAGQVESRAGAHPDIYRQSYSLEEDGEGPKAHVKDMTMVMPPGFIGNPYAVPFCSKAKAREGFLGGGCPPQTQVGLLVRNTTEGPDLRPLYNVTPGPGQLAEFVIPGYYPFSFVARLRASDQRMVLSAENLVQDDLFAFPKTGTVELWGVPADHQTGTAIPRRPFLTMPTSCGAPLTATARFQTWENPDPIVQEVKASSAVGGCNELSFAPQVGFSLEDSRADHASGADIELTVPQNEDPDGRASAAALAVNVALPPGMTFTPGSATGLTRCSDEQLGLGSETDSSCPPTSRIGTVQLAAAALGSDPARGTVYFGTERPGDRFRIFLVVELRGTEMKFVGSMKADPRTGQLTAQLNDLPQLAFDSMRLAFDGGPGALFATPLACGPAQSATTYTPSTGGPPVQSSTSVTVVAADGSPCAGRPAFAPSFRGGSAVTGAGAHTAFRALLSRRDGEQLPDRLEISLPLGMGAMLGSVTRCADVDAAAGSCPASSRIGGALAELGPGATPAQVSGSMSLTGPYRGQPFGLAVAFPGRIGALDLGTIVIRGSLRVDSQTGRLTAVLDSLPRLVEGIEVRFQKLSLEIDRSGFLFNPTACGPLGIVTTLGSVTGQITRGDTAFRVGNCVSLPFRPRFSLRLRGGTKAKQRPSLQLSGKIRSGGTNLRAADFLLPKALSFDAANVGALCAPSGAQEGRCPAGTEVGTASAQTPMLGEPLRGPIYATRPKQGRFPDLWASLSGGGVRIALRVQTGEEKGRATTKLREVPDLPINTLAMNLRGGKRGIVVLRSDLCAGKPQAEGELEGHNLARRQQRLPVSTACGKKR